MRQNGNRIVGYRSTRPPQLFNRKGANTRTASIPSTETARGSAEVELHHLTQSVKLFLRQPLGVKRHNRGCAPEEFGDYAAARDSLGPALAADGSLESRAQLSPRHF